MHLLDGMMRSQAIYTAAKLDLADRLGDGMKSISQLAQEVHMHEASLHHLLRALALIGIFAEKEPYTFTNTERSSLLRSDHPDSLRETACLQGSDVFW
jgi:predicted transcriptional regulator